MSFDCSATTGSCSPVRGQASRGSTRGSYDRRGTRLGKGGGYSDIEVALLQEAGRIGPSTVIVTTVHPLQVIDEPMPETEHDFSVDLIVTLSEVIACEPQRRPTGLYWNNLTPAKIAAIPVLAARATTRRR
jgi:5-formyltetrahydrofolate cyclo-ligase